LILQHDSLFFTGFLRKPSIICLKAMTGSWKIIINPNSLQFKLNPEICKPGKHSSFLTAVLLPG
jgi:hypothetical protein